MSYSNEGLIGLEELCDLLAETPMSNGGSTMIAAGGATDAAAPNCVPEQWACSGMDVRCTSDKSFSVPSGCTCDSSKPRSPADCPPPGMFACRKGEMSFGVSLPSAGGEFDCQCVAPLDSCEAACTTAYTAPFNAICDSTVTDRYLCGCAFITLK